MYIQNEQEALEFDIHTHIISIKATDLQIILENHEMCKYAKISVHIYKII